MNPVSLLDFGPQNLVTVCGWQIDISHCGTRYQILTIITALLFGVHVILTSLHLVCSAYYHGSESVSNVN